MQITDAQFCRNSSPPIQHFQHCHQSSHFQAVLRQIFCILWLSKLFNPAHCSTFGMENQNTISLWAFANPFQKKNVLACTYACTKLDKDELSPRKKSFRTALCKYWSGHSESNLLRPSITFSTLPEPCRDLLSAMRRRVSAFVENCREQWRWQSGGQCGPCVQQCGKRASQSGLNSAIKSHLSKVLRLFVKVGICTCQMCYTFCQSSYIYLWPLRVVSTVPSDHMYMVDFFRVPP